MPKKGVHKTQCKRGHLFTRENTLWCLRADGRRFQVCRTCRRVTAKAGQRRWLVRQSRDTMRKYWRTRKRAEYHTRTAEQKARDRQTSQNWEEAHRDRVRAQQRKNRRKPERMAYMRNYQWLWNILPALRKDPEWRNAALRLKEVRTLLRDPQQLTEVHAAFVLPARGSQPAPTSPPSCRG